MLLTKGCKAFAPPVIVYFFIDSCGFNYFFYTHHKNSILCYNNKLDYCDYITFENTDKWGLTNLELKFKGFRYNICDVLFLLAIVLQYAGDLPKINLAVNTVVILAMGLCSIVIILIRRGKWNIPWKILLMIVYMGIITMVNYHTNEAIKNFIVFIIFLGSVTLYYFSVDDKDKILSLLYYSAVILAAYGFIQEIGYFLGVQAIYDPTTFGFRRFYATEWVGNVISVYSLYDEPSHLASIFCAALLIGTHKDAKTGERYPFVNHVLTILVFVATLLTFSTTVYMGLAFTMVVILAYSQISPKKKLFVVITCIMVAVCACLLSERVYHVIVEKMVGLVTEYYIVGDMTLYAILSNFRVALAKMFEGHIFGTGYDSNRYMFQEHIDKLYGPGAMILNDGDGASLFTRIFSEFGIVGLVATAIVLIKKTVMGVIRKNWTLVLMVVLFLIQGSRNGSYSLVMILVPTVFILCSREEAEIA